MYLYLGKMLVAGQRMDCGNQVQIGLKAIVLNQYKSKEGLNQEVYAWKQGDRISLDGNTAHGTGFVCFYNGMRTCQHKVRIGESAASANMEALKNFPETLIKMQRPVIV